MSASNDLEAPLLQGAPPTTSKPAQQPSRSTSDLAKGRQILVNYGSNWREDLEKACKELGPYGVQCRNKNGKNLNMFQSKDHYDFALQPKEDDFPLTLVGPQAIDTSKPVTASEKRREYEAGRMTVTDYVKFFSNPEHKIVSVTIIMVFFLVMMLLYLEVANWVRTGFFKFSDMTQVSLVAVCILLAVAWYAFTAEQLKEQVNRFRENNKKLEKESTLMSAVCSDMKSKVEGLKVQLRSFQELQKTLKALGDKEGGAFAETIKRAEELSSKLDVTLNDNVAQILFCSFDKFSERDGDDGLSPEEYNEMLNSLPMETQNLFPPFERAAKGQEVIDGDSFEELIQKITPQYAHFIKTNKAMTASEKRGEKKVVATFDVVPSASSRMDIPKQPPAKTIA